MAGRAPRGLLCSYTCAIRCRCAKRSRTANAMLRQMARSPTVARAETLGSEGLACKQESFMNGSLTRREGHAMKIWGVRVEGGLRKRWRRWWDTKPGVVAGLRYKMTPKTIVSNDAIVSGEFCIGMRNILSMKSVNNCRRRARERQRHGGAKVYSRELGGKRAAAPVPRCGRRRSSRAYCVPWRTSRTPVGCSDRCGE